jgi:hypothetical protein
VVAATGDAEAATAWQQLLLLLLSMPLQERNIPQELDLARTAVETVVRQLTAVTKTNQVRCCS